MFMEPLRYLPVGSLACPSVSGILAIAFDICQLDNAFEKLSHSPDTLRVTRSKSESVLL